MGTAIQVQDDPELLDLIMADEASAPEVFRPTNYWRAPNEDRLLPELRTLGLKDFRRRRNSVLSSFGATDLWPLPNVSAWPLMRRLPGAIKKSVASAVFNTSCFKKRKETILASYVETARGYGEPKGARPLNQFSASLAGNPEELCRVGDNCYATNYLNRYMQYAYCCQFIDFEQVTTVIELGPGSGKQVEVIKKLHPHIRFLLFDLGPQLYICEQYLKSVFPNDVVSYRDTRELGSMPANMSGKIYMFGAHKFPLLRNVKADLFWNSASLQEMEPSVVANYLRYVGKGTQNVYLRELLTGHISGKRSVLEPVTFVQYINALREYEMCDLSRFENVGRTDWVYENYYDGFWRRR